MKIQHLLCSTLLLGLLAGCASHNESSRETQAQLEAEAKISRADAEKAALATVPNGTIKEAELEREKGRLVWSFDIATPGSRDITEVGVDALSGQVISTEKETPEQQAKESKEQK